MKNGGNGRKRENEGGVKDDMLNNYIPFSAHKRRTRKELIRLELKLQNETNVEIRQQIQRQINLCEALGWKEYKLLTK